MGIWWGFFDEPSQTNMFVEDANLVSPSTEGCNWLAGVFAMHSREKPAPC